MKCPYCNSENVIVLETKDTYENRIRRRRECNNCNKRFATHEITKEELKQLEEYKKTLEKIRSYLK